MNTNYTTIPLDFDAKLTLSDFNGAWYPGDLQLWDTLSDAVGKELLSVVEVGYLIYCWPMNVYSDCRLLSRCNFIFLLLRIVGAKETSTSSRSGLDGAGRSAARPGVHNILRARELYLGE